MAVFLGGREHEEADANFIPEVLRKLGSPVGRRIPGGSLGDLAGAVEYAVEVAIGKLVKDLRLTWEEALRAWKDGEMNQGLVAQGSGRILQVAVGNDDIFSHMGLSPSGGPRAPPGVPGWLMGG